MTALVCCVCGADVALRGRGPVIRFPSCRDPYCARVIRRRRRDEDRAEARVSHPVRAYVDAAFAAIDNPAALKDPAVIDDLLARWKALTGAQQDVVGVVFGRRA